MTLRTAKPWTPCALVSSRVLLRASALGLLAGLASACVSIGHGWWGDDRQACFDRFDDCMDDVEKAADAVACEATLDACLAACDEQAGDSGDDLGDDPTGDGDGDGISEEGGDDEGDDPPHAEEGGDEGDDPPRDDEGGDGDGDGDGPDPACFAIHATCIAEAETLQDIEACESLFENCINPGPCESDECEPGCPQEQLDACVSDYADCAAEAITAEQVHACAADFDGCIAQFDVGLCLPNYDDDRLFECLDNTICALPVPTTPTSSRRARPPSIIAWSLDQSGNAASTAAANESVSQRAGLRVSPSRTITTRREGTISTDCPS